MSHRSPLRSILSVGLSLAALPSLGGCDATTSVPLAPSAFSESSAALATATSENAANSGALATDQRLLSMIRQATARFQNIDAALAAGYVDDGYGCFDAAQAGLDPALGGMGFHLINEALHADPATDPLKPDLLVYEPRRGVKPKLVALEYEVFIADWYGAGNIAPPALLGHVFEELHFPGLDVFALHLWLWRDNPNGMFQDFNPKVSCQ